MTRLLRLAPFLLLLCAPTARAASISFASSQTSATAGDLYSLQVYVNAMGAPVVSSQFQLSYPPSLLTPLSFTLAPNWIQTFSPGTNLMGSGTVAQAGGYPSLFNGTKLMGTLSFMVLKPGLAMITLSRDHTFVFKTEGGNLFDGSPASAQVVIASGTSPVLPPPSAPSPLSTPTAPAYTLGGVELVLLFLLFLLGGVILWRFFFKHKRHR